MSAEELLEELKSQRASTKGAITRIKNFVNLKKDTASHTELECRLGLLETYWKAFLAQQAAIEKLSRDESSNEGAIRSAVEDLYCEIKSNILQGLPDRRGSVTEASFSLAGMSAKNNLPALKLPHFSGKYSDFPNFIAMFNKLVHNDALLSTTEKYNHLRNCLSGPALMTINSLGKSALSYDRALERLNERYDNNILIFQEHISEIFALPRVQRGSAEQLRNLIDNVNSHLCALNTLGTEKQILDCMIIHLVSNKLDFDSQSKWDESMDYKDLPSWEDCAMALSRRCQFLEARERKYNEINSHSSQKLKSKFNRSSNSNQTLNQASLTVSKITCFICTTEGHRIDKCPMFQGLSVLDRFEQIKKLSLCINCLSKGHSVKSCKSTSKCRICLKSHHTMLHRFQVSTSSNQNRQEQLPIPGTSQTNNITNACVATTCFRSSFADCSSNNFASRSLVSEELSNNLVNHTFLATAIIKVMDKSGNFKLGRALLDSASQSNFIAESFANCLGLKKRRSSDIISGIGENCSKVKYETFVTMGSTLNDFKLTLKTLILPGITGVQPCKEISIQKWKIPENISLADPLFYKPQKIHILIGAEKFFELLSVGQIKLGENMPILQKTLFGWIVSGNYNTGKVNNIQISNTLLSESKDSNCDENLNCLVEKFWKSENIMNINPKLTLEQQLCEKSFLETIRTTESGKIMVKLLFKDNPQKLGDSFTQAERRFYSLERRLNKNPQLKQQYADFINEYLELDHMELIEKHKLPSLHYIMPHHCVLRPESSSTKLRVVFDASAATSSNFSLNDLLMVGPQIQKDLFSILLNYRSYKFALTADIAKMFRGILIYPDDRNFQCILWRDDETKKLDIYRLKTVTYGTAVAPYLAQRVLLFLADKYSEKYPKSCQIIRTSFYMDDLLTGSDCEEELYRIRNEITYILTSAHLELKKWYSNNSKFLQTVPEEDREKLIKLEDSDVVKTLGLVWQPDDDIFKFKYKDNNQNRRVTKRSVLSDTARLFDPLGLVSPIILVAKIFLQELWLLKLDWDESLPENLQNGWLSFKEKLKQLNIIKIPRYIFSQAKSHEIELHGFSDASIKAMGCCIYVRSLDKFGNITVNLLTSKTRLAPTKPLRTLPCLELCAADLLTDLLTKIRESLPFKAKTTYLWSDSKIVLSWLASHPSNWQVFVANRVSRIQEATGDAIWNYVNTKSNPADLASRGVDAETLKNSIWFKGPQFLYESKENWPNTKLIPIENLPQKRKLKSILVCTIEETFIYANIYKHSNFKKVRRTFAYVLRFIERLKSKLPVKTNELTSFELERAFMKLIWVVQHYEFREEIQNIKNKNLKKINSTLQSLTPFLDEDEYLRVGGRLKNSDLPYNAKFPYLLPKNNQFVNIYITYLHFSHFHIGAQALLANLQEQFWIVGGRDYTRNVVKKCFFCFRYKPKLMSQIMGDLPGRRVKMAIPFETTGVDFCGPIETTHKLRGKTCYKSYIAIFICFAVKAVHIEVVSDLSSEAFIAALKRFISRRNLCKTIYCDNATNFVGASRLLKEFREKFLSSDHQDDIKRWCSEKYIDFRHIPPRSPHFGGLWESAVKSAKSLFYPTFGLSRLTFEELTTACCQIESILNSRPLMKTSTDPNDEGILTPSHFLNQASIDCFVEPDLSTKNISLLNRWQRISALQQHYWKRWSREYLSSLHQKYKWKFETPNAVVGMLVLIQEEKLPPLKWLMGKIVNIVEKTGEKVRVVDVKTKAGVFRRSIVRLAPLPIQEEEKHL